MKNKHIKKLSHFDQAKLLTKAEQIDHIMYLQKKIKGCNDVLALEGFSKLSSRYSARLHWAIRELRQYKRAAGIEGNLSIKR